MIKDNGTDGSNGLMMVLWLSVVVAGAALLCNPWKAELLRWLNVQSSMPGSE